MPLGTAIADASRLHHRGTMADREQDRLPDPVHERAGWVDRAIIYGLAPRNLDPPTFQGVAARLDDLAELGVSALWLSPINASPAGDYGYAVTDYFDLRPEYGTTADFQELVAAAHARGLRVLMDVVPNHSSDQHPYFQDAERHDRTSRYWDFYDRTADGTPTHYFNWQQLPNLNYANTEVQRHMLKALSYWIREFDVDGFRFDAVWGIRQRQPDWLFTLVAELRRIKPDALLIAEASARDPFYARAGFDAAYDWTDELGHWAWEGTFESEAPLGPAMIAALTNAGRGYHPDTRVLRFLNNNDTGARFISRHGVGAYRVALAMMLTLPGLPCLFAGDEVGAEYQPYETPGPIDWRDRHVLRPFSKRLIALRQATPALSSSNWQPLATDAAPLFAYLRTADGERPVLVALNFSGDNLHVSLPMPAEVFRGDRLTDLWSGETVAAPTSSQISLIIPGWGFRLLTDER